MGSKKSNFESDNSKVDYLRKIVDEAMLVAKAKGWDTTCEGFDEERGRFASLYVERSFSFDRHVTGSFEISLTDRHVKIKPENTSFYSNGLADLRDSIWEALRDAGLTTKNEGGQKSGNELSDELALLNRVLRRFHRSARQLKHRYGDREPLRISDEYDVQDFLHSLLRALFDDIRTEEYVPSYAGGASRVDFLLKKEKIAIEVKMASASLTDRKIGEQLIIDIERYQSHPDVEILYCFVYDPHGEVRNPAGLESDLSGTQKKLDVKVIVVSPS